MKFHVSFRLDTYFGYLAVLDLDGVCFGIVLGCQKGPLGSLKGNAWTCVCNGWLDDA